MHRKAPSCAETQWGSHRQAFGDLDRFLPLEKKESFIWGKIARKSHLPLLDPGCGWQVSAALIVEHFGGLPARSTSRLFRSHDIYFLSLPIPPEVEVSFYIAVIITPCHSLLSCHLISAEWVEVTEPFSVGGKWSMSL